jgi:hypothetical protein
MVCKRESEGWGLREYNRGDELVQSIVYTSMEISQ